MNFIFIKSLVFNYKWILNKLFELLHCLSEFFCCLCDIFQKHVDGWCIGKTSDNVYFNISVIIGVILIIIGLLFLFFIGFISMISGFELHIIGILSIMESRGFFLSNINHAHDFSSMFIVIVGVLSLFSYGFNFAWSRLCSYFWLVLF